MDTWGPRRAVGLAARKGRTRWPSRHRRSRRASRACSGHTMRASTVFSAAPGDPGARRRRGDRTLRIRLYRRGSFLMLRGLAHQRGAFASSVPHATGRAAVIGCSSAARAAVAHSDPLPAPDELGRGRRRTPAGSCGPHAPAGTRAAPAAAPGRRLQVPGHCGRAPVERGERGHPPGAGAPCLPRGIWEQIRCTLTPSTCSVCSIGSWSRTPRPRSGITSTPASPAGAGSR